LIRLLLIRPGAIGDFILSLPAMESLRQAYTEVWCAEQNVPLARFADAVRSIGSGGLDRLGFLPADDVMERLPGFDSIVSWYGANRPEFRELTAQLRLPIRFLPALPDGVRHAVDFYNAQAVAMGTALPSRFPFIRCPAVVRTFAAIHPLASSEAKRAPMGMFESIAEKLSRTMPVRWFCGPEELLEGAARTDDLFELACVLRGARVFVGNDSGISHLAAAVRTPCVTLFQSTDPAVWSPRGPSVWPTRLSGQPVCLANPSV
jgi:heptosyltransferase-2